MGFNVEKYLCSGWLKGADLTTGKVTTATIAKAYEHTFERDGEIKPVLEFAELDQRLSLNKTQLVTLIQLFGTNTNEWIGKTINLMPVPSSFQGKLTVQITRAQSAPSMNGQVEHHENTDIPF